MKETHKNIGWIILVVMGIGTAILALPPCIGAFVFLFISVVIAAIGISTGIRLYIEKEKWKN